MKGFNSSECRIIIYRKYKENYLALGVVLAWSFALCGYFYCKPLINTVLVQTYHCCYSTSFQKTEHKNQIMDTQ